MSTNDIPQNVIDETDVLAEQILADWDKWLEGSDEPIKIELREMQNQMLALQEAFSGENKESDVAAGLLDQMHVLRKQIKMRLREFLLRYKPIPAPKKEKKNSRRKPKRSRRS